MVINMAQDTIETQFSIGNTVFFIDDDVLYQRTVLSYSVQKTNTTTTIIYILDQGTGPKLESVLFPTAEAAAEDLESRILDNFDP